MKAMILAAGRGERMRPLTDTTPKPLLSVGGKPLIVWHLEKLAAIGVHDVVINTSWLADRFAHTLGDGQSWGLRLHYIYEGPTPLESGGGLYHALPLLRDVDADNAAFIAVNGDIWSDYDFARLPHEPAGDAHLVLIDNPAHNPEGDFTLLSNGQVVSESRSHHNPTPRLRNTKARDDEEPHASPERAKSLTAINEASNRLTFAGIGVYRPALFGDWRGAIGDAPGTNTAPPRFKLAPVLRAAMGHKSVTGELFKGQWTDIGTPQRLARLDAELSQRSTLS